MKTKPKILVIDDELVSRQIISKYLERNGFSVCQAEDGEAGLKKITEQSINAVVADYQMPKLDGIALLEKIQEINLDIPMIMVTGNDSVKLAVKAMQLGAVNYLIKPVDTDALKVILEKALEQSTLKRKLISVISLVILFKNQNRCSRFVNSFVI